MWPFIMMGGLYGLAGLIFVSRLGSAPAQGAFGLELNVIAAAVLGGTSLFGGVGTVGGAILGALLMESLSNGMVLLDVESYYQQVVVGLMLLIAVFIDTRARRAQR
jgi:ABC-type xylose transport system permease subunit